MGFGILLMGFLLSMSGYPGYTDCISFFIVFYAMIKLGDYNKFFRMSKVISFIIAVFGMAGAMLYVGAFIGLIDETNKYIAMYDNISEGAKIIFGVFMLLGLMGISRETDLPKQVGFGAWCLCIDALYAVLIVVSFFVPILVPWRMLVRVIYMLTVAYLIFCCYRMICLEGDESMPTYNSRFEFVNKLRRRLDEKAEEGNRKGAEALEYKRRKAEARKNGVDPSRKFTESRKKK